MAKTVCQKEQFCFRNYVHEIMDMMFRKNGFSNAKNVSEIFETNAYHHRIATIIGYPNDIHNLIRFWDNKLSTISKISVTFLIPKPYSVVSSPASPMG